jgi:hypothetical protein
MVFIVLGGGELNVSVSAESMLVMQSYRKTFYPEADNRLTRDSDALRHMLRKVDASVGAGRPRLRPEIAEFVDYSSRDPLWLRDQRGIVFPDFDYRPLEEGRLRTSPLTDSLALRDIVFIDDTKLAAILETLTGSAWALADQQRRQWIREVQTAGL